MTNDAMISTPEEKRKLSDLLQNMQISGSYDSALYANQYYNLINQIKTRDPKSVLTSEELQKYEARLRELAAANVSEKLAESVAIKEILEKRVN
jgi:hypothetical protein